MKICIIILLSFSLLFTGCSIVDDLRYGDVRESTLYESDRSVSFPNVVRLKTGEMLVVFQEDSEDGSGNSKILKIQSQDGKHWTIPDTLVSTGFNCQDPSVVQLRDGLIIVNFYQTVHESADNRSPAGCYTVRSFDNGKTFTAPRKIQIPGYEWSATSDAVLELKDGSLLLSAYCGNEGSPSVALIILSRDLGETWKEMTVIASDSEGRISYEKPAVCLLADGTILSLVQTGDPGSMLFQILSKDGGRTWSHIQASGIYGNDPDLLLTASGSILCVYMDSWPHGVSTMRSFDRGATWEGETVLCSSMNCSGSPGLTSHSDNIFSVYVEEVPGEPTPSDDRMTIQGLRFIHRKPDTPKGCSASIRGNRVYLRWNSVSGAVYYRVFREQRSDFIPGAEYSEAGNMIATPVLSQYTDDGVRSGQTYYYRISAVVGQGRMLPGTGGESDLTEVIRAEIAVDSTVNE